MCCWWYLVWYRYLNALRLCGVARELISTSTETDSTTETSAGHDQDSKSVYKFDMADLQNLPPLLRPPIEATAVASQVVWLIGP